MTISLYIGNAFMPLSSVGDHVCSGLNSLCPSKAIWQQIWVNIGSGNGLLPDGKKPLPEPMLTYLQIIPWHSSDGIIISFVDANQ